MYIMYYISLLSPVALHCYDQKITLQIAHGQVLPLGHISGLF